jgi:hypothetical protein
MMVAPPLGDVSPFQRDAFPVSRGRKHAERYLRQAGDGGGEFPSRHNRSEASPHKRRTIVSCDSRANNEANVESQALQGLFTGLFTSREGNARNGAELRRIHAFFGNDQQLEFGRRRPELPSILAAGVFEIVGVE